MTAPVTIAAPKRQRHEERLHAAVAGFLNATLPAGVWWTTFPAGGGGLRRGAQLKRLGLKAGVPDLLIVHAGRAIFCELKRPKDLVRRKGRASDVQLATHTALTAAGSTPWIATSIRDVEDCLRAHGVPTRGAVAA